MIASVPRGPSSLSSARPARRVPCRRSARGLCLRSLALAAALAATVAGAEISHAGAGSDGGADRAGAGAAGDTDDPSAADADLLDGEVIVVTGSRTEHPLAATTTATDVITRDQIEASGAENVADLLAHHPGLDVFRSFRGAAVRVQGLAPDYVLVLVDGERAIGRVGGAIDLERFAVEDIERIEIVKGPASALYGSDAIGGVIQIITRSAASPVEATVHAAAGTGGSLDASARLAGTAGPWRGRISAGWHRADAFDRAPADPATTGSAYDDAHVAARTSVAATSEVTLAARGDYDLRDRRGVDASASGAVFDRTTRTEIATASLRATWRPAPLVRVTAAASYAHLRDQYLSDQRGSDALDQFERTREALAEIDVQVDAVVADRHAVTVGAEASTESLFSPRLRDDGRRRRLGVFAQDEWFASAEPHVAVVPGVRVDVDSQFGTHATPKLAARWDVTERWVARASYGWGFRAPSFKQLLLRFENPSAGYRVDGNPDLEPETSRTVDAGVEARLSRRLWLAAAAFHTDLHDMIATDVAPDSGADGTRRFHYVNIASARTRGAELRARLRQGPATVALAYAWLDTLDRKADRALPGRAAHRLSGEIDVHLARWRTRVTARGSLVGARTFYADDMPIAADPYVDLDVRVRVRITDALDLFAGVANALDAGDADLVPIPPRRLYAGLTGRYSLSDTTRKEIP